MGGIVGAVKDTLGIGTTSDERAAIQQVQASQTQAGAEREALEYLKEIQAPITEAQTGSLGRLGDLAKQGANPYQLKTDRQLLSGIETSPQYQSIMSGLQAGEESILRNQAMTGGFRSGGTQQNLARLGRDTQNQALLTAFGNRQQRDMQQAGLDQQAFQNQLGLESTIMGLPSQVGNIAGLTSGIGQTLAQGQIGAAQTRLQGAQGRTSNMLNLLASGQDAAAAAGYSDRRLKDNIKKSGTENGFNVYTWDWNEKANQLGLHGSGKGVIADEVKKIKPEAVKRHAGFDTVDYQLIGVKNG
ncbi:MAG: tail fiber domain-containing protein [Colwellia sp.]|nr:tail fiber domain-containing protein [Colwellia sp.]